MRPLLTPSDSPAERRALSTVTFFGGNGHSTARLDPVRAVLASLPAKEGFDLVEARYPGFEDRPAAAGLGPFLAATAAVVPRHGVVYATGVGGLIALALRSRGFLLGRPLILQGPVLWGLETRRFPKLMRIGPLPRLLQTALRTPFAQRKFVRTHFLREPSPDLLKAFFDGYARCAAFAPFFRWFDGAFLRDLEQRFADEPAALENVEVWWGDRDRVVTTDELAVTERALGIRWPVRTFPSWGHYPMLDDPEDWVREVHDALARLG